MMEGALPPGATVWQVGALCRAVADALEARFNPIVVQGEVTGFSRAASGHCYLSLKDAHGQIRCAMFRRAASQLDFMPRDGEQVQVQGRLGVYEPRGDLQLIIDNMVRVGQGALFEQFLRLKAKLEAQGLFDARRKRPLPLMPRTIGLVTSLGAAALHDVVTALQRRAPHVRVVLAPAAVQGASAPAELAQALRSLYLLCKTDDATRRSSNPGQPAPDLILLVRGGGSLEDLWAFNDETLVQTIAQSPVPVIAGIGHETDFSLADFCADVRAPTPTAAAELATQDREVWLSTLQALQARLFAAAMRPVDHQEQRLDSLAGRLGRPSSMVSGQRLRLEMLAQRWRHGTATTLKARQDALARFQSEAHHLWVRHLDQSRRRLDQAAFRLGAVDPALILERGYAWVTDARGKPLTSAADVRPGQTLQVQLADGAFGASVTSLPST